MFENWVLDATFHKEGEPFLCFIPYEADGTLVTGMNILSDVEHFDQGNIVGIVHLDGQKQCDDWCATHPDIVQSIQKKRERK